MKKLVLLLLFVPIISFAQNQDYKASDNAQLYVSGIKLQDINDKYVSLKFGAPMMKVSKDVNAGWFYAELNWGQDKLLDNKGKVNSFWEEFSFAGIPSKRSRVYFNDISQVLNLLDKHGYKLQHIHKFSSSDTGLTYIMVRD